MEHSTLFRAAFSYIFNNDKDELDEAVSFLNLQGMQYKHVLNWVILHCTFVILWYCNTRTYICTLLIKKDSVIMPGTLLHFDDHGLRELYFLDPQWLAKLMAHVIHPYAVEGDTPVVKGKHISVSSLPFSCTTLL